MSETDMVEGDPFDPAEAPTVAAQMQQRQDDENAKLREIIEKRRTAFVRLFDGSATEHDKRTVMEDLKRFCRGNASAFHENERVHCLLTGRQEVYMRIIDHLTLTTDELVVGMIEGK